MGDTSDFSNKEQSEKFLAQVARDVADVHIVVVTEITWKEQRYISNLVESRKQALKRRFMETGDSEASRLQVLVSGLLHFRQSLSQWFFRLFTTGSMCWKRSSLISNW